MARTAQAAGRTQRGKVVEDPNLDKETAAKLKAIEEGTMQASLKYIDRKTTEQGQIYYAETTDESIPDQINWWSQFALCLVRHLDPSNKDVLKISLQVNSQHLKDILKETITSYPGVSFQTKEVTIDAPYHVLYHYKDELAATMNQLQNNEAISHLGLLLDFIQEQFAETIEETENLLEQRLMSYEHLWTIFKPNATTVLAPVLGQERAFKLQNYAYTCRPPCLALNMEYIDFDGEDFGTRSFSRQIFAFAGAEPINELSAYPIELHSDASALKQRLTDRGKHWESHAGMHFCCYNGIAIEHVGKDICRYNIDSRVVIDAKTFHRLNANYAFNVQHLTSRDGLKADSLDFFDDIEDEGDEDDLFLPNDKLNLTPLTDEQRLLASSMVRGFSFTEKRWLDFFVANLKPVDWKPDCFSHLVLPSAQKDLVQALVANHVQQRQDFDDIVKGKGKGLIFVLHGPPGVGKTLTAETVAEYSHRPLYSVSSGDLGTDSSTLDQRLSRILDMASTWRAVLLIDEADVFLERRSLHDLERNSLVSIFLRVLEYYEGILFLTSNRVSSIDDAFRSRIHVPLKYDNLTPEARKTIWKNFLTAQKITHMDEAAFDALAEAEINGRQIKNVIRTAKSLAQFHGSSLDRAKLEQVIRIQMEFEDELAKMHD